MYTSVAITESVAADFGEPLPAWIAIQNPQNSKMVEILQLNLDHGESTAIALALELSDATILMDEKKGKKNSERLKS